MLQFLCPEYFYQPIYRDAPPSDKQRVLITSHAQYNNQYDLNNQYDQNNQYDSYNSS